MSTGAKEGPTTILTILSVNGALIIDSDMMEKLVATHGGAQ